MAEILNKKAPEPEPFKIGKGDVKVKALRPVLLGHHSGKDTPVRVEKGEIGYVDEAELKAHPGILEKVLLLILFLDLLAPSVKAQSYSANQTLPTNSPLYATNINVQTGTIAGGTMATNAVPSVNGSGSTNSAVITNVVGLTRYDQASVQITWNWVTNSSGTIWLFLYPCDDGLNIDTNHPIASISGTAQTASTNGLIISVISNTNLGSIGYLGAGVGVQGSNSCTNVLIQLFVKPQRSG